MFLKYRNNKIGTKGFSLIEMLIYTALMTFFMVVSVNSGIILTGAYARARTTRLLNNAALSSLTKITNETRASSAVNAASVVSSNPGILVLSQETPSGSQTVEFYVENGRLLFKRGGVLVGGITPAGVTVDEIFFYRTASGTKESVRTKLTLTADIGGNERTETFYTSANLRGSYKQQ